MGSELYEPRGLASLSTLLHVKKQVTVSSLFPEERPRQNPTRQARSSWTSSLHNCEKCISIVVRKPHSLWYFVTAAGAKTTLCPVLGGMLVTLFRDLFRPSPPTAGLFSTEVTLLTRVQELQHLMRGLYSGPHHFSPNTNHKRQLDN